MDAEHRWTNIIDAAMTAYQAGNLALALTQARNAASFALAYKLQGAMVAVSKLAIGRILKEKGDLAEARGAYEAAIHIFEASDLVKEASYATCLNNLGVVLHDLAHFAEAESYLARGLNLRHQLFGNRSAEVGESLTHLGTLKRAVGDPDRATLYYRAALESYRHSGGTTGTAYGGTVLSLANLLVHQKAFDAAEVLLDGAETACIGGSDESQRLKAKICRARAHMNLQMGRLDEAYSSCMNCQRVLDKLPGESPLERAALYSLLGGVLAHKTDLKGARNYYDEALKILKVVLGTAHHEIGIMLMNIALLDYRASHFAAAERLLKESVRILKSALPQGHESTKAAVDALLSVLEYLRKYDEARRYRRDFGIDG